MAELTYEQLQQKVNVLVTQNAQLQSAILDYQIIEATRGTEAQGSTDDE